MDTLNNLITNITRVIEIACEECCLEGQTNFCSIPGFFCVQITSYYKCIGGKRPNSGKIDLQTRVSDDASWNEEIEIWTTEHSGIVRCRRCHVTKLIDAIMETKKAISI